MTTAEFIKKMCDVEGHHVANAVAGLSDADLDAKPYDGMMSIREMLAHLTECYFAFLEYADGRKYDWSARTFQPDSLDTEPLLAQWNSLREKAVERATASDDPQVHLHAVDFITSHDEYHVGQMCAIRLRLQPDWNPYAIYEG